MSWNQYISNLLAGGVVEDAVIVGLVCHSVWAAHEGGWLKNITPAEVKALADDCKGLQCHGVTLAGRRCTILRDSLNDLHTLDLKMKTSSEEPDALSITVGKSNLALIIARGIKGGHGGAVNAKVSTLTEHLRKSES